MSYDRLSAVNYAKKWALSRNPKFFNFDTLGGDCTNFVSQCVFAGAKTMNFSFDKGWYYKNLNSRSPSWTGVDFLIDFLLTNNGKGPFAREVSKNQIEVGDVIFLGRDNGDFYHTLFVNAVIDANIFVASHTRDAYNKPLSNYLYQNIKFLHIDGVRK